MRVKITKISILSVIASSMLAAVIYVALTLVMMCYIAFAYGYALAVLWSWFAVPLGLPIISMFHAAGLACCIGLFTYKLIPPPKESCTTPMWLGFLIAPWTSLLSGWILHSLM